MRKNFDLGAVFFGEDMFFLKSSSEVFESMSERDKELFYSIIKAKQLTLVAQWQLMEEALTCRLENKKISDTVRDLLLKNSLQSVSALAFKYLQRYNTKYTFGDFICEGYLALCNAFDKWLIKPDEVKMRNIIDKKAVFASFNTFASNSVKNAFAVMISKDATLSISLSTQKKIKNLAIQKADFIKKYGKVPTSEELATFTGVSERVIKSSNIFLSRVGKEIDEADTNAAFKEIIASKEADVSEAIRRKQLRTILEKYMKDNLEEKVFNVITLRFFKGMTQKETAKKLNLQPSVVRKLEKQGLEILHSKQEELQKLLNE